MLKLPHQGWLAFRGTVNLTSFDRQVQMSQSKFREVRIVWILEKGGVDMKVNGICHTYGISDPALTSGSPSSVVCAHPICSEQKTPICGLISNRVYAALFRLAY